MSYDTLGMIRRGWQDGAATVAPQVPGLGDMLEQQLEEAIRLGRLDEATLLSIVDAATQLAANTGAVDVVPALNKRLRRHVYEYLLSLDATPADRPASSGQEPSRLGDASRLIGANEVATLERALPVDAGIGFGEPNGGDRGHSWPSPALPEADPDTSEVGGTPPPLPHFSFHIGDPDDLVSTTPEPVPGDVPAVDWGGEGSSSTDDHPARRASFADPSTWPKQVPPTLRGGRRAPNGGSPVVEPPGPVPELAAPDLAGSQFQDLDWPSSATTGAPVEPSRAIDDLPPWPPTWPVPDAPAPEPVGEPHELGHPDAAPISSSVEWRPDRLDDDWLAAPSESGKVPGAPQVVPAALEPPGGWSVRQPEAVELNLSPPADGEPEVLIPPAHDVPESDLSALRAAVEQRLRKKRCEDAAALLQQAAQELGGQAVAELALDAGDRCRTLGKRNAALNCYLAASRADPVYEPPLARLADICIDDQDIDLAVSYLERIARLTRLRGDGRGALRIYRKIATIAPYRDDVLDMLMRAQTNGRMEQ